MTLSLALLRARLWRLLGAPGRRVRRSVAAKLTLTVLGALLLVVGIYTYLILRVRTQWLNDRLELRWRTLLQAVREELLLGTKEGHRPGLEELLAELRGGAQLEHALILDADQQVAFTAAALDAGPPAPAPGAPPAHALSAPGAGIIRVALTLPNGGGCRSCHGPDPRLLGTLVLDYPARQVEGVIRRDAWGLARYGACMLLMVGATVLLLTWVIVQNPLAEIESAMAAVRQGDLAARCVLTGADQLGQLAEGFNAMVASLQAKNRELAALHTDQMVQAARLASVGEMASGLAHEIKNPLHGIGGALSLIGERSPDPAVREVVGEMQGQLKRVVQLVSDMLHFAKPRRPHFEQVALSELVDKTLLLLQAQVEKHNQTVQRLYEPPLPVVSADREKLQQVLLNLLLNAIQAAGPDGQVTVRLRWESEAGALVVQVQDSGPGVDPTVATRIFEPFYTTKPTGNGLGLPVSRLLAEQHGGSLCLRPSAPGAGACFELRLPAPAAPLATPPPPASPSSVATAPAPTTATRRLSNTTTTRVGDNT